MFYDLNVPTHGTAAGQRQALAAMAERLGYTGVPRPWPGFCVVVGRLVAGRRSNVSTREYIFGERVAISQNN